MGCCGRPANNSRKSSQKGYYERYAYLSSHQQRKQANLNGSKCTACDAITASTIDNTCVVCGNSKSIEEKQGG